MSKEGEEDCEGRGRGKGIQREDDGNIEERGKKVCEMNSPDKKPGGQRIKGKALFFSRETNGRKKERGEKSRKEIK